MHTTTNTVETVIVYHNYYANFCYSAFLPYDEGDIPSKTLIRRIQYLKNEGMGVVAGYNVNVQYIY